MKIKLIVFDLDDTLLDTTELLIPIARTPAFEKRIREPLPLLPGAFENLEYLKNKYILTLLTQGRLDAQTQKVTSLGIGHFFQEQYFADPTQNQPKGVFFSQIIQNFGIQSQEMLSIGNRRTTDIREAKKVGAQTCLFKYGEHQSETVECPEDVPDFEINSHQELLSVCRL
ncbi:MAG: HAD family hydrolase [Pseudobdellovibrionaceae bacterium]